MQGGRLRKASTSGRGSQISSARSATSRPVRKRIQAATARQSAGETRTESEAHRRCRSFRLPHMAIWTALRHHLGQIEATIARLRGAYGDWLTKGR